ncbi:MAG: hypothetical protein JSR80_04030 [Verrucomicrobia bacterium]|nr:hypothetical protein [Verrucomicrobiota bacterium]
MKYLMATLLCVMTLSAPVAANYRGCSDNDDCGCRYEGDCDGCDNDDCGCR